MVSKTKEDSSSLSTPAMPRKYISADTIEIDRAARRRWYAENTEHAKAKIVARRNALRAWFQAYRATLCCSACPESDPDCLDFHHVESRAKDSGVTNAIQNGWSIERVKREIAKCVILCGMMAQTPQEGIRPRLAPLSSRSQGSGPVKTSKDE